MMANLSARLFLAQRVSAVVLAVAVAVHLVGILVAVRTELTAADVLARTRGNGLFLAYYSVFVIAAAVHAPIGLRNVVREWSPWRGRSLDLAMAGLAGIILLLGLRAAIAVYAA